MKFKNSKKELQAREQARQKLAEYQKLVEPESIVTMLFSKKSYVKLREGSLIRIYPGATND